jgi:hypothetical protein
VAAICCTRYQTVLEAYRGAIVMMAELLGWTEDDSSQVG